MFKPKESRLISPLDRWRSRDSLLSLEQFQAKTEQERQQLSLIFQEHILRITQHTAIDLASISAATPHSLSYVRQKLELDFLFASGPSPAYITLPAWTQEHQKLVLDNFAQVAGVIFPYRGETLEQAHKRAQNINRQLRYSSNRTLAVANGTLDLHPIIAVADPEQLKLWREAAAQQALPPLLPYRVPTDISTTKLCQLLTRALSEVLPPDSYWLQVHALENHEYEVGLMDRHGKPLEMDFLGLESGAKRKQPKLEEVDNVIGFKCFPLLVSNEQRLEETRQAKEATRLRHPSRHHRGVRILSVNATLLREWEEYMKDDTFICRPSENPHLLPETTEAPPHPVASSFPNRINTIRYVTHEHGEPSIGAKPSFIEVHLHDGRKLVLTLDAGAIYEGFSWKGPFKPSIELGIAPYENILPQVPGWFRLSLLLNKAKKQGLSFLNTVDIDTQQASHSHFQLFDLFQRLRPAEFRRFCQRLAETSGTQISDEEIESVAASLQRLQTHPHFSQTTEHIAFLISHFHDDHIGFAAMVSSDIPQVQSIESLPFVTHFSSRSQWQSEVTTRRDRPTLLKEGSDRSYQPPLLSLMPYETRFLAGGLISVTSLPCDHSIYGSTMFLITVYDDFALPLQKILYTGDYRFGDSGLTEKTMEILTKIGVDTLVTDTTNIGINTNIKPKEKPSPEELLQNYADVMTQAPGAVLVQLDPKDIRTSFLLEQAAKYTGRQLVVNLNSAAIQNLFLLEDQASNFFLADPEAQALTARLLISHAPDQMVLNEPVNLLEYHPRPRLDSRTFILDPNKKQLSPPQRAVKEEYGSTFRTFAQLLSKKEQLKQCLIISSSASSLFHPTNHSSRNWLRWQKKSPLSLSCAHISFLIVLLINIK